MGNFFAYILSKTKSSFARLRLIDVCCVCVAFCQRAIAMETTNGLGCSPACARSSSCYSHLLPLRQAKIEARRAFLSAGRQRASYLGGARAHDLLAAEASRAAPSLPLESARSSGRRSAKAVVMKRLLAV